MGRKTRLTDSQRFIGLRRIIDCLDGLKHNWSSFIRERLTLIRDNSCSYGHIDSGCASTLVCLLGIWIIFVLLFTFVFKTKYVKGLSMLVVGMIIVFAFVGLGLVVFFEAILKLLLKLLEKNTNHRIDIQEKNNII